MRISGHLATLDGRTRPPVSSSRDPRRARERPRGRGLGPPESEGAGVTTKRRRRGAAGSGCVRWHKASGKYTATIELPRGPNGKRRRRVEYCDTEREAVEELKKLHADAKAGLLVDPD